VKSQLPWLGVQRRLLHMTDENIESYTAKGYTAKGLRDAS
jgi:hypothetical protein